MPASSVARKDQVAGRGSVTEMASDGTRVAGVDVDARTRCEHYSGPTDVVGIKFDCCGTYYACYRCHEAKADHPPSVWKRTDFDERAVLCGVCGTELTIRRYLDCDSACPECDAAFNPGCRNHRHRYFEG